MTTTPDVSIRPLSLLAATVLAVTLNLVLALAASAQPVVTTLAATSVTTSNATLNGTVNPNGGATTAYFQYGLTTNYGSIGAFTVLPATNATQILPGFVATLPGAAGANWTQSSAPLHYWHAIASSADGTRLAAVAAAAGSGPIYTSTNSGANWTPTSAPGALWYGIASSADGTRLAAVQNNGGIRTSTNSGATWTPTTAPSANWYGIASSTDGTRLAAVALGGGIYISNDGGLTWTPSSAPTANWVSIASSADGMRLAAVISSAFGRIWASTNGGLTWAQTSAPESGWSSIVSSADGTRLAAVANAGGVGVPGIFISTNSGGTWTQTSGGGGWYGIAGSADLTRLAAVVSGGGISTSTDGGLTWMPSSAPSLNWRCVASSADGTRMAAGVLEDAIYTSTAGASPGMTPGTLYHYRLVGINSAGTTLGSDMIFTTTGPGAPTVATLGASDVTATNATLNGTVNTGGLSTSAYFQYGLTTNYGSFSATNTLAATNTTLSVSNLLGGLSHFTTYHFRMVGSNSMGTSVGGDQVFITAPLAPVATTSAATSITAANATLNGSVNPNGAATTAWFRYGLTTNYGSYSATNVLVATNISLSVSRLISNLTPAATYHFQLVAINAVGTSLGSNLTFTTGPAIPIVTTLAASGFTPTNITLNGTVNPNGAATWAWFRYGLTTNYGSYSATNALVATNISLSVSRLISNLTPGTTYHFQLAASNSLGTSLGNDLAFITASGLTLTNPYAQAVLADNPIGYWRLDETNGSVAHDYFGANSGFYTNALLGQPGNTNVDSHTAVRFGSVSNVNSYVGGIPINFATTGNATFSVECWANGGAQTNDSGIITRGTGGGGEQFNLDCGSTGHAFRFFVRNAAGGVYVAGGNVVPDNTWHHLVGVCDQANGKVILYVDGVSNASSTITPGSGLRTAANPATFGSRQSGAGAYDFQFVGSLEEVAIYTNALSAARVLAHYQAGAYRPQPVFSSVEQAGTNLIFTVTNGTPGGGWTLLTTTNLTVPVNWTTNRLGTFDGLGRATLTNGITGTEARRFFTIRAP